MHLSLAVKSCKKQTAYLEKIITLPRGTPLMRECFSSAKGLIYSQNVTLNSVNNIESSYKH